MQAMLENPPADTRCIFKNIQGIKSEAEYYQRFYELLVQCLNRFGKSKTWLNEMLKGIKIDEITLEGVKFGERKDINFAEEIQSLLSEISKNKIRVVLLLDELPEVLDFLHKQNRNAEASHILNHLRELRQNPNIRGHLSLVLAGSVGIQHVVKAIEGRIADLNDFNAVPFEPLSTEEAQNYLVWATQGATVQYDAVLTDRLLNHVRHFIPYFINLMLDEINKSARKANNPVVTIVQIDAAFTVIVKNSDHFKEWKNRLNDYFSPEQAAEQNSIYRLSDLWFEVLEELGIRFKKSLNLRAFDSFEDNQAYTRCLYAEIHRLLQEAEKRAVLLLDNLDRILENFDDDANMFRETLLNYPDIQIIGGSTRMNEHFWRYDQPFYDFFRHHRLEGLSFEEIHRLLNHWAAEMELPVLHDYALRHRGRVEAIRILTDGLPRALQYFIQVPLHDS